MKDGDASPRSFQQTLPSHLPVARWLSGAPAHREGCAAPSASLQQPQSARAPTETLPRQMAMLWDETRCLRQQLEAVTRLCTAPVAQSSCGDDGALSLRNELTQHCNSVTELLEAERAERLQALANAEQVRRAADEELSWKFKSGFQYLEGLLQLRTEAHNDMQGIVSITESRLHRLESGNGIVSNVDAADASSLHESSQFPGDAFEAMLDSTQKSFASQSSATSKVLLQRQLSAEKWGSMNSLNALQKFLEDRDDGLRREIARLSSESEGSPQMQASLPPKCVGDHWPLDDEHKAAMKELFINQNLDLEKSIALEKVADENKQQGLAERFEALARSCWREAERSSYFAQTLDERFQEKFTSVQTSLEAQLRQSLQRLAEQQDRRCSELSQEVSKLQQRQEGAATQDQLQESQSSLKSELELLRSSLQSEMQKQMQECRDDIQSSLDAKDRSEDVPGLLDKLAAAMDAKLQQEISLLDLKVEGSLLLALEQQSARHDALMDECKQQFQGRLTKSDTLIEECRQQFQERLTKNDTLMEECMHQFQERLTKHDHQVQRDIQLACAAVNGALQDVQSATTDRLDALEPWRSSMDGAVTDLTSTVNSISASLSGSQLALNKLFEGQKTNVQMMIDGLRELVVTEKTERRYQHQALAERVTTLEQSLREGMLERAERVSMLAELLVQKPELEPEPAALYAPALEPTSLAPVPLVPTLPVTAAPVASARLAELSPRSQSPLRVDRSPRGRVGTAGSEVAPWMTMCAAPPRAAASSMDMFSADGSPRPGEY